MNEEAVIRALAQVMREEKIEKPEESGAFRRLLQEFRSSNAIQASKLPPEEVTDILRRRYEALSIEHRFVAGQLVKWKKGLKNKRVPKEDEPAIVMEVFDNPILDLENGAGSPYFREPLDLVLGILDPDGDFIFGYFDKRRFEPYP